jgi:hypothetical protein
MYSFIVLSGKKGSGKSTVAEYLRNKYGYVEYNIASSLKEFLSCNFKLFYGIKDMRRYMEKLSDKENVGINLSSRGNYINIQKSYKNPEYSIRKFLQETATTMREIFGNDIFISNLCKKILSDKNNSKDTIKVVITDVRFDTELEYIISKFGNVHVIKIVRDTGKLQNDDHVSEQGITKCDTVVQNSSTKEALFKKIDNELSSKEDTLIVSGSLMI